MCEYSYVHDQSDSFGQKVESSEIKIHRKVGPSTRSPTKRACVNGSRSNGAGIADKGSSRQHQ